MDESSFREEVTAQGYSDPTVVEWAPGVVNESHSHDFGATILVLSGDITVTTEAGTQVNNPGICRHSPGASIIKRESQKAHALPL